MAYGTNKKSDFGHRWLLMGLTWRHGQDWITLPLRIDILGPLEHSPERHLENLALILKRLRIRPRVVLLDREYDTRKVRQVAKQRGAPLGLRIRFTQTNRPRRYVHLESGERATLQDLLDATAADTSLPIDGWYDKRSGYHRAQRTRTLRVRFDP